MSLIEKYKTLDSLMQKKKYDEVEKVFHEIITEAIELVNEKAEKEELFDIENPIDLALVRAMFEYMLELWSEGAIEEAKELGYDMAYSVKDPKIKEMFSMFVLGILDGLGVNQFLDKYVDDSEVYKDYFFTKFHDEIDELLIKHKKRFEEEFSKDAR